MPPRTSKKSKPQPPIAASVRLALAGIGLSIGALAYFLLRPQPVPLDALPPTAQPAISQPVEAPLNYDRLLRDQEVEVDVQDSVQRTQIFYLWSGRAWKDAKELELARVQMLISGASVTSLQRQDGGTYLRLGPFASASDRNNMRQELVKKNLQLLTFPPTDIAP